MTRQHDLSDDDVLAAALSAALDDLDPVPEAAVAVAATACDLPDAEVELAALVAESSGALALMRDESDHTMLTFAASQLTVEIEIDREHHAVGVITPPASTTIEVETSRHAPPGPRTVRSDDLGRFRLDLDGGLCRLRIGAGRDAVVVTSWFHC
jgi:hypothetical protein